MLVKKIKHLIERLPPSQPQLTKEVDSIDHFKQTRFLQQLSVEGKVYIFDVLGSS
jgi:hypothetical protein